MKVFSPIINRSRVRNYPPEYLQLNRNTRPEGLTAAEFASIKRGLSLRCISRYPDCDEYLEALSGFYMQPIDMIAVTSGIDGAIRSVIETFTAPKDRIAYFVPCYTMYRVYSKAYDLEPIEIGCDANLRYEVSDIYRALESGIRVLFLTNPHSPIDFTVDESEFANIVEQAGKRGITVFVDEAYHHFGAPSFLHRIQRDCENLFLARTFSKAFGLPGIRLGTLFGSATAIRAVNSRRLSYESNCLSMSVAMAAMSNFHLVEKYTTSLARSRDYIKARLNGIGFSAFGDNLNSVVVKVQDGHTAKYVIGKLFEHEIVVRTLPDGMDSHLLIGLGNLRTMKKFWKVFCTVDIGMGRNTQLNSEVR